MAGTAHVSSDAVTGLFLQLLHAPRLACEIDEHRWEQVIRLGRLTRLLAVLGERIEAAGASDEVPATARAHFQAEAHAAAHQRQMIRYVLAELGKTLVPLQVPMIALKGASYILQDLPFARGRMLSDVDVMVPRRDLERVETTLRAAGWESEELHSYDERYYRLWTHELPPLRHPAHHLELDLHHTILPLTSRVRPAADALFASRESIPGSSWAVLCAEDQVVHACLHLFHDSDCSDRLRDLVDLEGLFTAYSTRPDFWRRLYERARLHRAGRAVWYGVRFARSVLGTSLPSEHEDGLARLAPPVTSQAVMNFLIPDALLPTSGEARTPFGVRARRSALFLRSHWLRMPPWLLARHAVHKGGQAIADWWQQFSTTAGASR
jgi:hypothetical protein